MQRIVEMQSESLRVAEMQEDDSLQIEIEALKLESETCLAGLQEKVGMMASISPSIQGIIESFENSFYSLEDF